MAVRYAGPAVVIDEVAAVAAAAGPDSETRAAESAAETASASEADRLAEAVWVAEAAVLMDKSASVAAGLDSEPWAAESAAKAASASEAVRSEGPAVLIDEVAAVAARTDSKARAVEPAAEAALAFEAERVAEASVPDAEAGTVSAKPEPSVEAAAALAAGTEPGTDDDAQAARSLTARLNESAGAGTVNEVRAPKPSSALRARLSWWPLRAYGAALIFGM